MTLRGENCVAILDVERAARQAGGTDAGAILRFVSTVNGPAQVWFSTDVRIAFGGSQKVPRVGVLRLNPDQNKLFSARASDDPHCRARQARVHAVSENLTRWRRGMVFAQARGRGLMLRNCGAVRPARPRTARQPSAAQPCGVR